MGNTRDFTSLGVWGADAVTPLPVTPVTGVAYRDETTTEAENKNGEPYNLKLDSAKFNQKMFIVTSFIDLINKKGIVGWTDLVDYDPPAFVWGSDGNFYFALQPSGPSTTPRDPISEPTYWEIITSASQLRQDLSDETPGSEGSRLVGYNKFDINGGVDDGLTVKQALDEILASCSNLQGLKVLMSGRFSGTTGLAISNTFNIYQNKAFIDNINGDIIYTVYAGDDEVVTPFPLVFVSTSASESLENPANAVPTILSIVQDEQGTPGPGVEDREAVLIRQYVFDTQSVQNAQEDFSLLVASIDPIGVETFPP